MLRQQLVSNADFHKAMREAGCADIARICVATLETDGRISIVLADQYPAP